MLHKCLNASISNSLPCVVSFELNFKMKNMVFFYLHSWRFLTCGTKLLYLWTSSHTNPIPGTVPKKGYVMERIVLQVMVLLDMCRSLNLNFFIKSVCIPWFRLSLKKQNWSCFNLRFYFQVQCQTISYFWETVKYTFIPIPSNVCSWELPTMVINLSKMTRNINLIFNLKLTLMD